MARHLNQRHIKILGRIFSNIGVTSWDDIPLEDREVLEKVNDYETLWSDAQRWLEDRCFDKKYEQQTNNGSR